MLVKIFRKLVETFHVVSDIDLYLVYSSLGLWLVNAILLFISLYV